MVILYNYIDMGRGYCHQSKQFVGLDCFKSKSAKRLGRKAVDLEKDDQAAGLGFRCCRGKQVAIAVCFLMVSDQESPGPPGQEKKEY